eukprot:gene10907-24966_t
MPLGGRMRGGRRAFAADSHMSARAMSNLTCLSLGCLPSDILWPACPVQDFGIDTRRRGYCLRDFSAHEPSAQLTAVRKIHEWITRLDGTRRTHVIDCIVRTLGGTTDPGDETPATEHLRDMQNTTANNIGCTKGHAGGTAQGCSECDQEHTKHLLIGLLWATGVNDDGSTTDTPRDLAQEFPDAGTPADWAEARDRYAMWKLAFPPDPMPAAPIYPPQAPELNPNDDVDLTQFIWLSAYMPPPPSICLSWLQGGCPKGVACNFDHAYTTQMLDSGLATLLDPVPAHYERLARRCVINGRWRVSGTLTFCGRIVELGVEPNDTVGILREYHYEARWRAAQAVGTTASAGGKGGKGGKNGKGK